MADLYSIPGITDDEVRQIQAQGYESTDDVWKRLAEDKVDTLADLARRTGLPPSRLAALLGALVQRDARPLNGGFLHRHWMDLAVLGGIALLVWAMFFWGAGDGGRRVLAKTDLPAFHEIGPEDLDVSAIPAAQRQAELKRYAGRYTKQKIPAGAKLTAKLVGAASANLKGLALLRVSLKLPPADADRKEPYQATLIVSPAKNAPAAVVAEVTVLAYYKDQGPAAIVALKPDRMAQIGLLIGGSNVYLAQPPQ